MGISDAGILSKIVLAVLPLGILLTIIGLATPNWTKASHGDSHAGLWAGCSASKCETLDFLPGWYTIIISI